MSWKTNLTREVHLKSPTLHSPITLKTLQDASNLLMSLDLTKDEAGTLLVVLLGEAATTTRPADIAAATDLLERFVASKGL